MAASESTATRRAIRTNAKIALARRNGRAEREPVVIPDKLYFRIGEVSDLCRLPASVLRFWETEFPQLKPSKSSTGQRMYRRRDVEHVLRIKELLYTHGFTINGARQLMRTEVKANRNQSPLPFPSARPAKLKTIRAELEEVVGILKRKH